MSRSFVDRRSVCVRCAPEKVLDVVRDSSSWPKWQPEILSAKGPSAIQQGDVVNGTAELLGFRVEGSSTALSVDGGHVEEDVVVGVRMRIRYDIVARGDATAVTRTIAADLPGGIAGRTLAFFLRRRLSRMQERVLSQLRAYAEEV